MTQGVNGFIQMPAQVSQAQQEQYTRYLMHALNKNSGAVGGSASPTSLSNAAIENSFEAAGPNADI